MTENIEAAAREAVLREALKEIYEMGFPTPNETAYSMIAIAKAALANPSPLVEELLEDKQTLDRLEILTFHGAGINRNGEQVHQVRDIWTKTICRTLRQAVAAMNKP